MYFDTICNVNKWWNKIVLLTGWGEGGGRGEERGGIGVKVKIGFQKENKVMYYYVLEKKNKWTAWHLTNQPLYEQ